MKSSDWSMYFTEKCLLDKFWFCWNYSLYQQYLSFSSYYFFSVKKKIHSCISLPKVTRLIKHHKSHKSVSSKFKTVYRLLNHLTVWYEQSDSMVKLETKRNLRSVLYSSSEKISDSIIKTSLVKYIC